MRARRAKGEGDGGNPLSGLQVRRAEPDPEFRAVLRERLVTAVLNGGEDHRNSERTGGRTEALD
ncbi:hypothetical protein SMC26_18300 [Actinomadura fulvescens]